MNTDQSNPHHNGTLGNAATQSDTATPTNSGTSTVASRPVLPAITHLTAAKETVRPFLSVEQFSVIEEGCKGEEAQYFVDLFVRFANVIQNMPQTYDQDGKGDAADVHLHYFLRDMDWYILEKDADGGVHQAFGYANLGDDDMAELGYISIAELIQNRVDLDLHWQPRTLGEVKAKRAGLQAQVDALKPHPGEGAQAYVNRIEGEQPSVPNVPSALACAARIVTNHQGYVAHARTQPPLKSS